MRKSSLVDNRVVINAVGDVWFGDHPVCIGHGVNAVAREMGPEFLFDGTRHLFADGDINFCNLEGVLSEAGMLRWWLPSIEMRGFPECADGLVAAGINVVNVANNHILQHGLDAFNDTLDVIESAGIDVIGLDEQGRSRVLRCTRQGIDFAFVGYSMHPENYYDGDDIAYSLRVDADRMVDEISELRSEFDGFIICTVHWGREFIHYPTPEQVMLAHRLVDAGVNLLLGHHPHVLQGCEEYHGALICYSLGNFIFDLWPAETKRTALLRVEVNADHTFGYSFIPLIINNKYQPVMANDADRGRILAELQDFSDGIREGKNRLLAENNPETHSRVARDFRYSQYRYFFRNLSRYSLLMTFQSICRTILRRLMLQ